MFVETNQSCAGQGIASLSLSQQLGERFCGPTSKREATGAESGALERDPNQSRTDRL